MSTVDVIIPVYNPGEEIFMLIESLRNQSVKPSKIILMNTEKKYIDALSHGKNLLSEYPEIEIEHLKKSEFDHGKTRNKGVDHSDAEYFLMMTQDAFPRDNKLIENLLAGFDDENVAVSYARQYPRSDCNYAERFSRKFNYPSKSIKKTKSDINRLGIKTYFCSNVCALYKRKIFDELGGFINKAIFNEDMIYAEKVIANDYAIYYASDAGVIHSHNYSLMQQFHRNFDIGVSQAQHPEVFENVSSEGEGIKMVKQTINNFISLGKIYLVPHYIIMCGGRFIGYKLGKNYKKLPRFLILKFTMNKSFWA
ncbi:MAG: glycosyltransferase [Butyrivibrio sp.]|nr:glycosyltransferase [Butyrivibrio sp.]